MSIFSPKSARLLESRYFREMKIKYEVFWWLLDIGYRHHWPELHIIFCTRFLKPDTIMSLIRPEGIETRKLVHCGFVPREPAVTVESSAVPNITIRGPSDWHQIYTSNDVRTSISHSSSTRQTESKSETPKLSSSNRITDV